jgi:bifunctional non-homologous end joining protein LigD
MGLETYKKKRDFARTPEPEGKVRRRRGRLRFVVQEHHASILHWDFRLEMGGVLKSWSIPKGPSLDPATRRLAVEVEDHPVDYINFTGKIADGNYGAGTVYRWDTGAFEPEADDPVAALEKGALAFTLDGKRLRGAWRLFRMKGREQNGKPAWLLQKVDDRYAVPGDAAPVVGELTDEERRRLAKGRTKRPADAKPARVKRVAAPSGEAVPLEEFFAMRKPKGDLVVDVEGTHVPLTSLDRVYWPKEKITKFDILRYYANAAPRILPFLTDRPAILQRFPRGIQFPKFFQHDLQSAPEFVRVARMRNEAGREIDYAVYTNLASLLYIVNLGTLEHHPWHSRMRSIDRPDWIALDLDPKGAPWRNVLECARAIGVLLDERGLVGFPKTSGSSGIHVYLPLQPRYTYARAAAFAEELASEIARRLPKIATVERSLAEREKRQVYVDWLQNARG